MTTPRVFNSFDQINKKGEFQRTATDFHQTIEVGAADRYILYVSLACPWASTRVLTTLALKGLDHIVDVCTVHPVWGYIHKDGEPERKSWVFGSPTHTTQGSAAIQASLDIAAEHPDDLSLEDKFFIQNVDIRNTVIGGVDVTDRYYGAKNLRHIYELSDPTYEGRYTTPVLFDTETKKILNTESAEIMRILDGKAFEHLAKHPEFTIHPKDIDMAVIEQENEKMYQAFNNGVYKAGFAQSQIAYNKARGEVIGYLDYLEEKLKTSRFIAGQTFSEPDIRAISTLLRYDSVYVTHFKLSEKRITDYPTIHAYLCDIWQNILNDNAKTFYNETHIKFHYYCSHEKLNPFALVPFTHKLDLDLPVNRTEIGKQ